MDWNFNTDSRTVEIFALGCIQLEKLLKNYSENAKMSFWHFFSSFLKISQAVCNLEQKLQQIWNLYQILVVLMPMNLHIWDFHFLTLEGALKMFNLIVGPLNVLQFFSNFIFFIYTCNLTTKKKSGLIWNLKGNTNTLPPIVYLVCLKWRNKLFFHLKTTIFSWKT